MAASAEIARWRGRLFAAGRAALKAGGVWTVELFESPAPSGYSGGVAAPGDEARVRRGGALHREGGGRKVYTRLSLYANSRRTPAAVTEHRRFDVLLRGATGRAGRWNASVRVLEERESQ